MLSGITTFLAGLCVLTAWVGVAADWKDAFATIVGGSVIVIWDVIFKG